MVGCEHGAGLASWPGSLSGRLYPPPHTITTTPPWATLPATPAAQLVRVSQQQTPHPATILVHNHAATMGRELHVAVGAHRVRGRRPLYTQPLRNGTRTHSLATMTTPILRTLCHMLCLMAHTRGRHAPRRGPIAYTCGWRVVGQHVVVTNGRVRVWMTGPSLPVRCLSM